MCALSPSLLVPCPPLYRPARMAMADAEEIVLIFERPAAGANMGALEGVVV